MRLLTDVTPLREYPAYRRLWLGMMLSRTGSAMTTFAISLQVYDLTRSPAAVGGIGVATFVPMLLITVPGGTLADRVDRRRLVLATIVGQAVLSAVLFALAAFGGASLWALYALVAVGAALSAVNAPGPADVHPPARAQGPAGLGDGAEEDHLPGRADRRSGAGRPRHRVDRAARLLPGGRRVVRGSAVGRGPPARDAARGPGRRQRGRTVRPGRGRPGPGSR